jgi:C4-type Zn-finger protein
MIEMLDDIIKSKQWKCPSCGASSIALNIEKDHQHFSKGKKIIGQLMKCCNCQSTFIFEYELFNITIHTIKRE